MTVWTEAHLSEVRLLGQAGNQILERAASSDWDRLLPAEFGEHAANWVSSGDVLMARVDPHWQEDGRTIGALWSKIRNQFSIADHEYWDESSGAKLRIYLQQLVGVVMSAANYGPPLQAPPPPDGIGVPRCHFHKRQVASAQQMVFVAMPFAPTSKCDAVLAVLRTVCDRALGDGVLNCVRADDLAGQDVMQDVYESIARCGAVIVDTTGLNANVFIELGMAITLGKPLILISRDDLETIPFDLRRFRHFGYTLTESGFVGLADDVARALATIHRLPVAVESEGWRSHLAGVGVPRKHDGVRIARMTASTKTVGLSH